MIRHFFLDKTNSIINNSHQNVGLNPILYLGYGNGLMRGLIHFNIEDIKKLIDDKTFANVEKLRFYLTMTNCYSVADMSHDMDLIRGNGVNGERATSFDLMLFKLPCEFDAGRGYEFISDFWNNNKESYSTFGSNWYRSRTNIPWLEYGETYDPESDKGGIYNFERLVEEYDKFKEGNESIIIGTQHFDFGNENLHIDITNYVMDCLKNNINYGLCLSFTPEYEMSETEKMQCVDFFTDHTNTFFHPFVEAIYDEYIVDRRMNFTKSNNEKIYLYAYNNEEPCNLDNIPTCMIDEKTVVPVKQATKGVYYAEISSQNVDMYEDVIYYDTWSEIALNGDKMDDVEMSFYVNPKSKRFSIGDKSSKRNIITPSIYGINDGEDLLRNEIREVVVDFVEKYSSDKQILVSNAEYRLYVKDGDREINVIENHPIELANMNNFFLIHTMDLIPGKYFVDIKVTLGREKMTFKNVLRFNIINNITNR